MLSGCLKYLDTFFLSEHSYGVFCVWGGGSVLFGDPLPHPNVGNCSLVIPWTVVDAFLLADHLKCISEVRK